MGEGYLSVFRHCEEREWNERDVAIQVSKMRSCLQPLDRRVIYAPRKDLKRISLPHMPMGTINI